MKSLISYRFCFLLHVALHAPENVTQLGSRKKNSIGGSVEVGFVVTIKDHFYTLREKTKQCSLAKDPHLRYEPCVGEANTVE